MVGIIYYIKQVETSKMYIGLTTDYKRRKKEHLYDLRHNKHHNQHLQNVWNKYGELSFEFGIMKEIIGSVDDLKQAEISLIDTLDTTNKSKGFNVSKGGDTAKWRSINQYTKDGKFIQTYDTIALAAAALGKLSTPIWRALNGKLASAHGYQWRYCDSVQNVRLDIADHSGRGCIEQYDLGGILVREYANAMDAGKSIIHLTQAKSYKSVAVNIRKVCYGQMKQYQNFIWKFKK